MKLNPAIGANALTSFGLLLRLCSRCIGLTLAVAMLTLPCMVAQAADEVGIKPDRALLGYVPAAMNLIPHTYQWNEGPQELTLAQVQQAVQAAQFTRVGDSAIANQPFSTDGRWYRVEIENLAASPTKDWVLELAHPILQTFELHLSRADGSTERIESGDQRPRAASQLPGHTFAFPVRLMPGEQLQIHLHVATQSSHQVPLQLWPRDAYMAHAQQESLLLGLYCGLIMVMMAFGLFVLLSLHDLAYIHYMFSIACLAALNLYLNGYAREYLLGEHPHFLRLLSPLMVATSGALAAQFSRTFLSPDQNVRWLHWGLLLILTLCVAGTASSFWLPYITMSPLDAKLATAVAIASVIAGIALLQCGVRITRFYLLVWLAFILGVVTKVLQVSGAIPVGFVSSYGMQISSALQIILLALALSDRINSTRKEKRSDDARQLQTPA